MTITESGEGKEREIRIERETGESDYVLSR